MAVTVIVGGQFGSEGKGKTAYHLSQEMHADIAIKVGGANSGHTAYKKGEKYVFKTLPTPALHENIISVLPSGAYFTLENIKKEMKMVNISKERLVIDPYSVMISPEQIGAEKESGLITSIGSTGSGTGACIVDRVNRKESLLFAKDCDDLKEYIGDTKIYLRNALLKNKHIMIEATQGFGLSLLHSNRYPYVTSRDTTAASVLSEVGLSPFDVTDIVLTLRAFPIRVAGNSGDLPNEISWKEVTNKSGSDSMIEERTSVTKNVRRVAEFDEEVVLEAIRVNQPSIIVMNHLDYVDYHVHNADSINENVRVFVKHIEEKIERTIDYYGVDPYKLLKR